MKQKVVLVSRVLLGVLFLVFGANGFLMVVTGKGFIPMPPPSPEAMTLMTAFMTLKYMLPLVKLIEIVAGLLLLVNRYINLAIVLLGPIIVNILCVHYFLDPSGLTMSIGICGLFAIVVWDRWNYFKGVFSR